MRDIGEVVLYEIFCALEECRVQFHICRHCYHGQRYCSEVCRKTARHRQQEEARRRYRNTPEAKLDQRDRQRQWRERQGQKNSVMDQGSPGEQNAPPSKRPDDTSRRLFTWMIVLAVLRSGLRRVVGTPYCVICGCVGKYVNPYHPVRRYKT